MSDNEKYNWAHASHDYGYGWSHGFQSRGIAPSFLGSDSLPQGLSDLHWTMHGIQHNVDNLDAKVGTLNDNIAKIANDMKEDIIKGIEKSVLNTNTNALSPLTDDTSTVSKVMTTRTRIFSDSFGPETNMPTNDRIRGLTKNYDWIQYSQKNPTCEGDYDKVIDFNFVSDHQEDDALDSRYVSKGKIILDKAGLIKRVYVTQHGTNIVLWYLVTQSVPSETGVAYTGSVRRVEYDYKSNLVSEKWVNLNHTPLILLGAFSADVNDETEFIQYISTDYKVYQHKDGSDKELGVLPTDIVMLIDPLNDIVSDTKEAYIMKYDSDGKLLFPLEGFTLIDTVSGDKIINKFSKISLSNNTKLLNNIVSISPRTDTLLTKDHGKDIITLEGGYHVEVYDNKHKNMNVSHSHILLLSSSKENKNIDSFAPTMMNFYTDKPSEFALKRERDYTEFNQITFKSGIKQMFPEIVADFGIPEDTMFTLETDWNNQKERVTIWLKEPFVLERNISTAEVNNRLGYTVVTNSDYVTDKADTNILSVYRKLDFVNKTPNTRDYLNTLENYSSTYKLPKFIRYRVVSHSDVENDEGITEVTYFDKNNSIVVTLDSSRKNIIGNIKFNENMLNEFERTNKRSPIENQLLSKLLVSDVIYLEGMASHNDKPYGSNQYTLMNESTGNTITQRLLTSSNDKNLNENVEFTRVLTKSKVGEWTGNGYISSLKYLNIPGIYHLISNQDGSYFHSSTPSHRVFTNIVSRTITVDGSDSKNVHVVYKITNDIGLSMEYHNVVIREDRENLIGYTSKPWRLMFESWIPGEYIGNDEFPLGPDNNSVTKYLLKEIKKLNDELVKHKQLIDNMNTTQTQYTQRLQNVENALKGIVGSLRHAGAWDSETQPDNSTDLRGSVKQGVNIAYGNINLFGGTPDGNSFIRTNNGSTENDLSGGI